MPDDKSFYFYSALNFPSGVKSANLGDFLKALGTVDLASIKFHLMRDDFENWIRMLGDDKLATEISYFAATSPQPSEMRQRLEQMVKSRIEELHLTSGIPAPNQVGSQKQKQQQQK